MHVGDDHTRRRIHLQVTCVTIRTIVGIFQQTGYMDLGFRELYAKSMVVNNNTAHYLGHEVTIGEMEASRTQRNF